VSRSLGSVGVVLAWLAAVVAATLVGVLAVGAIGSGILPEGQQPLSQAEVSRKLSAPPTSEPTSPTQPPTGRPSSTPRPTAGPSSPAAGPTEALHGSGGVIYARCNPGVENGVEITSATPDQGYHFDQEEPEDGGRRVRFESGDGSRIEVQVNCVGGTPRIVPDDDDDDRSGHGDD
jgi:hypothetical protein